MSLLNADDDQPDTPGTTKEAFRAPPDVAQYLKAAQERGARKTDVIVGALRLDRNLEESLEDVLPELRTYARSRGLTLRAHLHLILAELTRAGLRRAAPANPDEAPPDHSGSRTTQ